MSGEGASVAASKTITVILVDDHPVVRAGYRRLLEGTDNIRVVAEADNGDLGYRAFIEHTPDVVVMDLNMPGASGLEAVRRILSRDSEAKVLVFSVHDNEAILNQAMKAGVRGYLTKRSAPETMVEAIETVAGGQIYIDPIMPEPTGQERSPADILSPREFEVFRLLIEGKSVAEIADILVISPKTAGVHHTRIMQKLNVSNRAQLAQLALQHGLMAI
ncbi:MAG: response regulator transcription factor [Gammaproteobacteria bacterium]|nr:response regulator transcription factor [Gammaproteobacteria bacterium]